jgi:hypothetical protein
MRKIIAGQQIRLAIAVFLCAGLVACNGRDRADEVQDLPPGTVPVPGAASPGSAPDPHPGAAGPDAPYPGTVGPVPAPVDTVEQPELLPPPDTPRTRQPGH